MLNSVPELVRRCAEGDTALQKALLDEIEPLVFLLDLRAGRVRLADVNAMRRTCHELATVKRADPDPWRVRHEGDPESGALTPFAPDLAARVEAALDADGVACAARRFRGRADPRDEAVFRALAATGVPERGA
jgi:hypothetical protein